MHIVVAVTDINFNMHKIRQPTYTCTFYMLKDHTNTVCYKRDRIVIMHGVFFIYICR